MLNKDLELTLNAAFREARTRRHEFMTVEHLLLALLDNPSAGEALNACGVNLSGLKTELLEFIDETIVDVSPSLLLAFGYKTFVLPKTLFTTLCQPALLLDFSQIQSGWKSNEVILCALLCPL